MPKLTIRLIVALLAFLLGVAATMAFLFKSENRMHQGDVTPVVQERQELRLIIPDAGWEPIFFKPLNELTTEVNLPKLRTVLLPDNDFEVRVWAVGGGQGEAHGFMLKRSAGQWATVHLRGMGEPMHVQKYEETLATPISGWERAWERLMSVGLLTLPDGSEAHCNASVIDGVSYIVEINMNKTYRTYMYENPKAAKCNEARQMTQIVEIIDKEFGW
jgi:hypothetical protein